MKQINTGKRFQRRGSKESRHNRIPESLNNAGRRGKVENWTRTRTQCASVCVWNAEEEEAAAAE